MSKVDRKYKEALDSVWGWKIDGDKIMPPQFRLPSAVIERIDWFDDQITDGLTFLGALELILAYDEERAKADCELGGNWLPVSDEFKKWRDQDLYGSFREQQIALALMYGAGMEDDK